MQILKFSNLVLISFLLAVPVVYAAEGDVPSTNSSVRDDMVENELQAAAEQARIQAEEQTQEKFLNIEKEMTENIGDVNSSYDKENPDPDNPHAAPVAKPSVTQEATQENYQNFQNQVGKEIKSVKKQLNQVGDNFEFESKAAKKEDAGNREKKIELALQIASYKYQSDDNWPDVYATLHGPSNKVEKSGSLYGIYGSYTYHRLNSRGVHSWSDLSAAKGGPGAVPTFWRLELGASFGDVDYKSFVSGKRKGFAALQGDIRALGGYDFYSQDSSFMMTPYSGLGYRRFSDKSGGWVDWVLQTYTPYETIYNYFYLPVGIETLKHVNNDWDLGFRLEGSYVFAGEVQFYHSDIGGIYTITDIDTGLPVQVNLEDATSRLEGGFGLKTSFKMIRKFDLVNVFAEPFLEYWNLRKTKNEVDRASGVNGKAYQSVNNSGSPYKPLYEPANYTLQCGVRVGVQF